MDDVEIKIVTSDKGYAQAMEVRKKVFVEECHIPENMEFDGNDHSSTHVLALKQGQPIGVMRIRYFNGFVKMERMCVLPEYRKTDVSDRIMRKGMEFSAQKGYDKVYGVCKKELLKRWMENGFYPIPGAAPVKQNGMTLVPIYSNLQVPKNVLTMQTPTEVLNMTEDTWSQYEPAKETFNKNNEAYFQSINRLRNMVRDLQYGDDDIRPNDKIKLNIQGNIKTDNSKYM